MTRIPPAAPRPNARPLKRAKRTCFSTTATARYNVVADAVDELCSGSLVEGNVAEQTLSPRAADAVVGDRVWREAGGGRPCSNMGVVADVACADATGANLAAVDAAVVSGGGSDSVSDEPLAAADAPTDHGSVSAVSSESDTPFYMGWSDEEDPASVPQDVSYGRPTLPADASAAGDSRLPPAPTADAATAPLRQTGPPFVVPPTAPTSPSASAACSALKGLVGQAVTCAEELFAHFLLRGQYTVTNKAYTIVRADHNYCSSLGSLPALTTLRTKTLPVIKAAWFLPTSNFEARTKDGGKMTSEIVLPSTHVARDFAFQNTYGLFTAVDDRPQAASQAEPEFVGTPFFRARQAALMGGELLTEFSLAR